MSNARNLANLLTGGDTTIATGDVANGAISTAKLADDAVTAAKIDDDGAGFQMGDLTLNTLNANTAILPDTSGGADIGSTTKEFGDVFIADDKAIKFGNDQDVKLEHVADSGLNLHSANDGGANATSLIMNFSSSSPADREVGSSASKTCCKDKDWPAL